MNRAQVLKDIESTLGIVPSFFKGVNDATLEMEWNLFRAVQIQQGAIPAKYRELIELAACAVNQARYGTMLHTELARQCGANDAEIQEALQCAQSVCGWNVYTHGLQLDWDQCRSEIARIVRHLQANGGLAAGAAARGQQGQGQQGQGQGQQARGQHA